MKVPFIQPGRGYKKYQFELDAVWRDVCSRGDFILRQDLEELESNMALFLGTKYFVGVNSGTDAIYIALKAAGVKAGHEVITVAHTFQGTVEPIVRCGATPVLVDIDDTYLMDVSELSKRLNEKTKAIIPVHLSGDVCDMDSIKMIVDVFNKNNRTPGNEVVIIEDAAQAFGADWKGRKAGSIGLAGCFSFYFAKLLGCYGDAGGICTSDDNIYREARLLRNHYNIKQTGLQTEAPPEVLQWCGNSRMDNLQAAILKFKLGKLGEIIEGRQKVADRYNTELAGLPIVLPSQRKGRVYQDYVIKVDKRDGLKAFLDEKGVYTLGTDIVPLHKQKGYGLEDYFLPKTEKYTYQFLRLPCNEDLTDEEVTYVIDSIKEYYGTKVLL